MGQEFTITVRNDLDELGRLAEAVEGFAEENGLPSKASYVLMLVLEEFLSNIIKYGYTDDADHEIVTRLGIVGDQLIVRIEDDAKSFDPRTAPEPDTNAPIHERPIGGLGLHMVRQMTEAVDYERAGDKNITTTIIAL